MKGAACLVLATLLVPMSAFAQTVQVTDREIHFTVSDHKGQFVANLSSDEFALYDNDVRQKVVEFNRKLQSPVNLAVVIDRSSSVGERFSFIQEAAAAFLKSVISEPDDKGIVVAFDSKVYVVQDWTADAALLVNGIEKLSTAGGTSVFDAVYKTCRDKFNAADDRQKVIVLITDGEDTTSNATLEQALAMAKLANVAVYVIGIRAEESLNTREMQGRKVLTDLAELSGGRIYYPKDSREQLASLFQTVQSEIRNEYSIVFEAEGQPDDTFHKIRIEPREKALTVHAPPGYFFRKSVVLP